MKKISIIAAHPDDEAFGCGGTILKHRALNSEISCLWLTDGIGGRSNDPEHLITRKNGVNKVLSLVNPKYYKHENFPDNQLDTVPFLNLTQTIEKFLGIAKPDVIYTHFINDLNIDHSLTCKAVMTATRPGSSTFVKEIYSFEVVSSTEWSVGSPYFTPDTYIDISSYIDQKKEYLECYKEEMRLYPHPRSMENIIMRNALRGAEVNIKYAEAFVTLRRVLND